MIRIPQTLTEDDKDIIQLQDTMDPFVYVNAIDCPRDLENEIYVIRSVMVRLEQDVKFRKSNPDFHARCIKRFNLMFQLLLKQRSLVVAPP